MLDGNAVRSVDRAASLLIALGESQGEAGVTELARRLGLHKSTASRLLATLQKRAWLSRTTTRANTDSDWRSFDSAVMPKGRWIFGPLRCRSWNRWLGLSERPRPSRCSRATAS